jgi:probable phosphoglycerate mutase
MTTSDTRLVLIRHGESQAQVNRLVSGHDTCTGLSDLGRRQAAALRDRLAASHELDPVDVLYTSILERAIETAEIIRPALGVHPEPLRECDWCEVHPGDAEGLTWEEAEGRFRRAEETDDPFRLDIPRGETWSEFSTRVGNRLRRVADDHPGQRVVVVCHGGVVGASFIALGELPVRHASSLTFDTVNTSITEWRRTGAAWRLVRYNDAAHLLLEDALR